MLLTILLKSNCYFVKFRGAFIQSIGHVTGMAHLNIYKKLQVVIIEKADGHYCPVFLCPFDNIRRKYKLF